MYAHCVKMRILQEQFGSAIQNPVDHAMQVIWKAVMGCKSKAYFEVAGIIWLRWRKSLFSLLLVYKLK